MNKALTQEQAAATAAIAYRITTVNKFMSAMRLYREASELYTDSYGMSRTDRALWAVASVYAAGIMEGKRQERARRRRAE